MNPNLKDGPPTGRIRDNLMEINLFVKQADGAEVPCGTRWVEITEEQRQLISGASAVVSMGASPAKIEEALNASVSVEGNKATYSVRIAGAGVPGADGTALADSAVPSLLPQVSKDPAVRAAQLKRIAELDAQLFQPLTGQMKQPVREIESLNIDSYNLTPEGIGLRGTVKFADKPATPGDLRKRLDPTGTTSISNFEGTGPIGTTTMSDLVKDHLTAGTHTRFSVDKDTRLTIHEQPLNTTPDQRQTKREHSGFNVNYYSIEIKHPKRPDRAPYVFEVEDLIQASNMTFQEGTLLKSLFRSVMEREFGIGKVGGDYIRDAEKMVHSAQEVLRARKIAKEK